MLVCLIVTIPNLELQWYRTIPIPLSSDIIAIIGAIHSGIDTTVNFESISTTWLRTARYSFCERPIIVLLPWRGPISRFCGHPVPLLLPPSLYWLSLGTSQQCSIHQCVPYHYTGQSRVLFGEFFFSWCLPDTVSRQARTVISLRCLDPLHSDICKASFSLLVSLHVSLYCQYLK